METCKGSIPPPWRSCNLIPVPRNRRGGGLLESAILRQSCSFLVVKANACQPLQWIFPSTYTSFVNGATTQTLAWMTQHHTAVSFLPHEKPTTNPLHVLKFTHIACCKQPHKSLAWMTQHHTAVSLLAAQTEESASLTTANQTN